jgi:cytochrome c oxidase cbb3-type subunit 3
MADFTSNFWHWFISIVTVLSLLGCVWLVRWQMSGKIPKGEKAKPTGHKWDENLEELNNPMPGWWLNLFYITLVFGAIYLVLYPGLGTWAGVLKWSSKDGANSQYAREVKAADDQFGPLYAGYLKEDIAVLARNETAMKTGTRLFLNYCAVCHGSTAEGNPGGFPNLKDTDWLYGGNAAQIKQSIMTGRAGVMPAWGAVLGNEGVVNVSEYVLSLAGRRHNATAASVGKEKYGQLCASCHGADGKGNYALGAPNLTDSVWLHGSSQKAIMETIANGRQGRMPAHGDFLGEAKVHLLAAYVYSLSQ